MSISCKKIETFRELIMKQIHTRSSPSKTGNVDLTQKVMQKQEFGRRLYNLMIESKLNQSALARLAGLGRDSISQYVRGRSVPTPINLQKLAGALNLDPDILYPNYAAAAAMQEEPTFQVRAVDGSTEEMWLNVNMKVSVDKSIRIMAILNEK